MRAISCPSDGIILQMRRCALFRDADIGCCQVMAEDAQIWEYGKGEILVEEGHPATCFFIVISGCIKVVRRLKTGRDRVLHVINPGGSAAAAAMFRMSEYPATVIAVDDSRVVRFSRESLQKAVRMSPDLAASVIGALSMRLRMFTMRLGAEGSSADTRIAGFLLHRASMENSSHFRLPMPREEMASMLGIARETLSRTLSRLVSCGAITVSGRVVDILNHDLLEVIATEGTADLDKDGCCPACCGEEN